MQFKTRIGERTGKMSRSAKRTDDHFFRTRSLHHETANHDVVARS